MRGGRLLRRAMRCAAAVSLALALPAAASNPIADENALPGTSAWEPVTPAGPGRLEAYASATSVQRGESIALHVRADAIHDVTWALYRVGYYGGAGARAVAHGGPVTVYPEPLPVPDPSTGLLECAWPVAFTVPTDPAWTSGVYLVKLTRDDGLETYAIFVVRADDRKGVGVVQASVATWQAYNEWGGESLYTTALGLDGGYAKAVSFDRPYADGYGTGEFFYYEVFFLRWLESAGYDVTYLTNVDVGRDPSLLTGQKLFVVVGHDEYWTLAERAAVEAAVSSGVSAAFLAGNSAYLQIRLEPSSSGVPYRTQVCFKDLSTTLDPLAGTPLETALYRSPALDRPENALLGVMADAWQVADVPWVVQNAGSWPYAGTGLADGDVIPLVVGYESDRVFDNGRTPPGLTVLSRSPLIGHDGRGGWQNASVYVAPSGAFVFAAAAVHWALGLGAPGRADPRVQRITANVLAQAGLAPATAAADFGASAGLGAVDLAGAATAIELLGGAPGQEGLVDGPLAQARFRRPTGVAVDAAGNLFVADTGNHAVRRIDATGARAVTTIAGTGAPGLGEGPGARAALRDPQGVAVADDGTVFVTDTGNHRVVRIARDGVWTVSTWAGSAQGATGYLDAAGTAARFSFPIGLAAVGQDLYVADPLNNRLRRVDAQGTVTTVVGAGAGRRDGPGASALLYRPTGVALSAGGALLVLDTGNRLVRRVALDGAFTTTTIAGGAEGLADGPAASARLMPYAGITEQDGNALFADLGGARVRRVAAGHVTTFAGAHPGAFALPAGLAVLPDRTVVVVDEGDSTLRRLLPPAYVPPPAPPAPTPPPASSGPGPAPLPDPRPEPIPAPGGDASGGAHAARGGGCGASGDAAGWATWVALLGAAALRTAARPRRRRA